MKDLIRCILKSTEDFEHYQVIRQDKRGKLIEGSTVYAVYAYNNPMKIAISLSGSNDELISIVNAVVPEEYNIKKIILDTWFEHLIDDGCTLLLIYLENK